MLKIERNSNNLVLGKTKAGKLILPLFPLSAR